MMHSYYAGEKEHVAECHGKKKHNDDYDFYWRFVVFHVDVCLCAKE